MDTTYIILCNGNAQRWGAGLPEQKWLAEVDGQPNLLRTIAILRQAGIPAERVICATREQNAGLVGDHCHFVALPETASTCETILKASHEISGKTVFLLGDVIYTPSALNRIVSDDAPIRFYGRPGASRFSSKIWGEIFALRCTEDGWRQILPLADELSEQLRRGKIDRAILWDLYFGMVQSDRRPLKISRSLFAIIDDQTDDYDTREEYSRLLSRHNALHQGTAWARIKHLLLPSLRYRLRQLRHTIKRLLGLRSRSFVYTD